MPSNRTPYSGEVSTYFSYIDGLIIQSEKANEIHNLSESDDRAKRNILSVIANSGIF